MNKTHLLTLLPLTLLLASCSGTSSSLHGSPVYTVTFYDEAGTEIGYSYAIEGKAAVFKDKDPANKYDYLPRLKKRDSGVNASYYVFEEWSGTYEDGTPIDPFAIREDCALHATFVRKEYRLTFRFRSEAKTLYKNTAEGKEGTILYGKPESGDTFESVLLESDVAESFSVDYPFAEDPTLFAYAYYQIPSFEGFQVGRSSLTLPIENGKIAFKADVATFSRDGLPSLDPKEREGSFLLNDTPNAQGNQDYPLFYSDGEKWLSLSSMSALPILALNAAYSESLRSFEVYAYASKDEAKKGGGTPLVSLPYGTALSFKAAEGEETADTLHYTDASGKDVSLSLPTKTVAADWDGFCYGFDEFDGKGKPTLDNEGHAPFDPMGISGNLALYPKEGL